MENDTREYPATIPSSLSLDLIDNHRITDPYYRDNFLKFYQYETKDATYSTSFTLPSATLTSYRQFLVFEGLDTYAEVRLNNLTILSAQNMFRRYQVPVTFKENNTLTVHFTSSAKMDLQHESEFDSLHGFRLPQNYSFTRKAAYQYGWDWGPRILTVGIWKEVSLLLYNHSQIEGLRLTHSPIGRQTTSLTVTLSAHLTHLDAQADYQLTLKAWKQSTKQYILDTSIRIESVS